MHLRDACPSDVAQIQAVVGRAYSPYVERMDRTAAPLLSDYETLVRRGVVRVGVHDGQVIAVLVMWPAEDHLFVENLAVDPGHHGRGFGVALLADADRAAIEAGQDEIRLYTNEAMSENLSYYPKQGFEETHRTSEDGYSRVYYRRSVSC